MILYKIRFKTFPKIKFACTACTDKYKNVITYRKDIIEFSVNSGAIKVENEEKEYCIPENHFHMIMPDMNIKTYSDDKKKQYHNSAAIEGEFDFERVESDDIAEIQKLFAKPDELILPMYMPLGNEYVSLERRIKNLISCYLKETAAGELEAVSIWCDIAAKVSDKFKMQVLGAENENIGEYYSRKARRYIETHYREKLTVKEIAKMLNISPNYLSNVFRKNDGRTLTEFIATTKLAYARRLVYEGNLSYDRVAAEVGICSEKYLNRLFKKYYGTSIKNCAMIDHEISLYHDKPWDRQRLTEDIFKL